MIRLLSESEVTHYKKQGLLVVGQCHAAGFDAAGQFEGVCENTRRSFKRTCEKHKTIRGSLLEALVASRSSS